MSDRAADDWPRVHAAIVHFPVAAWTGAALLELTAAFRDGPFLWSVAVQPAIAVLNWTGIATAAAAMTAGVVELSRLPEGDHANVTANRHMLAMSGALACFLLLGLVDALHAPLAALGLCCLAAGGHLGSRLAVIRQRAAAQSSR